MRYFRLINAIIKGGQGRINLPPLYLICYGEKLETTSGMNEKGLMQRQLSSIEVNDIRNIEALDFLNIVFLDMEDKNQSELDRLREFPYIRDFLKPILKEEVYILDEKIDFDIIFEGIKLYREGHLLIESTIIIADYEGLGIYVDGDLTIAKGGNIRAKEEFKIDDMEGNTLLHVYVSGNIKILEGASIRMNGVSLVCGGNIECEGEILITGKLVAGGSILGNIEVYPVIGFYID